jgi:hypothetical protein
MTPMAEDKNDKSMLWNMEVERPASFTPMFYTASRTNLMLENQWQGQSCFLVSNGPSLKKLDLSLLKKPGVIIISLNNGPTTLMQHGITPNFWTCVDQPSRFIKQLWLNPGITKFVPMASFDKPLWDNEAWRPLDRRVKDCPNVVGYCRNEKFAPHRFFSESSINWGCHQKYGGCRTVLLPAMRIPFILGFRTLYLVGVDLHMDEKNNYHFDEGRTKGAIKCNNNTYKRIIEEYGPGIKKYGTQLGYSIFNCNPDSKLKCFDHKPFAQAVADATAACGPSEKIQSAGMYIVWDEKSKLTREQAMQQVNAQTETLEKRDDDQPPENPAQQWVADPKQG